MKTKVIPNHVKQGSQIIWSGDASDVAVCAYSCVDNLGYHFVGKLADHERKLSSGHRELLTVKYALSQRLTERGPLRENTTMYWLSDSENLVGFLTKGSRKQTIQELVLEVLSIARESNLHLVPIHLRREDPRIQMADAGSKIPDSDDWSVDDETFKELERQFGPFTIDLFAEENNFKVGKFYANYKCPSAHGVNAFCHSWDNENAWICPPVKKIIQVIKKIQLTRGSGLLVVPEWPTASFWPFIQTSSGKYSACFKRTIRFRP